MKEKLIYLDTYVLQQDMRVRLPKAVLTNMKLKRGKSRFDIYYNSNDESLVLKIHDNLNRS